MSIERFKQLIFEILEDEPNEKITKKELWDLIEICGLIPFASYFSLVWALEAFPNKHQIWAMVFPMAVILLFRFIKSRWSKKQG